MILTNKKSDQNYTNRILTYYIHTQMFRRINFLKSQRFDERRQRKRIGKYQIVSNLSAMSLNKLYIGIDRILGQYVSIKQISLNSMLLYEFAKNQIQTIKSLHHPNILAYYHHHQSNNFIYLITELCQSNLYNHINIQKIFSVEQSLLIFSQIIDGYSAMRQQGFIHRDLKPQNILIKNGEYKIGDFGFAVKLKSSYLKDKYNIGSPFYMAPQVLLGNKYSEKGDIWSLGLILYELINGKLPFKSRTQLQLKRQILIPINTISQQKHPLNKLIKKCLQIFMQKRINLKQLKQQLNNILNKSQINKIQQNQCNYNHKNQNKNKRICQLVQYQIIYIKLLQYVIKLSQKCRNNFKPQRIAFIGKIFIKIKINKIKDAIRKCQQDKFEEILLVKKEVQILQELYSENPVKLDNIDQKSRFHYFDNFFCQNKEESIWQIQAILKQQIERIYKQLKVNERTNFPLYQQEIKLLDFIITIFALNRLQILDKIQLLQESILIQTILNSPMRVNLQTFANIESKLSQMKIF